MADDFPESVKRTLASRVGSVCSRPDCSASTSGPQDDPTKAVNVGVAAHITASSPGGPRYDPELSAEERSAALNGIWLCQNCAKLVHNDPSKFTVDTLKAWKQIAEDAASDRIGKTDNGRSRARVGAMPVTRPQLRILRWGQVSDSQPGPRMLQRGFYVRNFGMGETAIGVQITLFVPVEIPDKWTSGEGSAASAPSICIDSSSEVFVPVFRALSQNMFTRWDLEGLLIECYENSLRPGNQDIMVTMRYGGDGKRYLTRQSLIYSPERKTIVGFGEPKQMPDITQTQSEPFLELLRERQLLEDQIATLEKELPENVGISVRPIIKVGKDKEDYLREEIQRKKNNLKEVMERMRQ